MLLKRLAHRHRCIAKRVDDWAVIDAAKAVRAFQDLQAAVVSCRRVQCYHAAGHVWSDCAIVVPVPERPITHTHARTHTPLRLIASPASQQEAFTHNLDACSPTEASIFNLQLACADAGKLSTTVQYAP